MRDVVVHPTATELLALLLEDRMIKDYLPRYNIRQKKFPNYRYLKLVGEDFAKIEVAEVPGENTFGPFKDKYFIERIETFACEYYAFCRCTHTKHKCCYYDMTYCKAPHKNKRAAKSYHDNIKKIKLFLMGQDHKIVKNLQAKMHECAQNLLFEKAEKYKNDYLLSRYMIERYRFCSDFIFRYLVIWENNEYTYIFFQGQLLNFIHGEIPVDDLEFPTIQSVKNERFYFDRAGVIFEWLQRQSNVEYSFFSMEKNNEPRS